MRLQKEAMRESGDEAVGESSEDSDEDDGSGSEKGGGGACPSRTRGPVVHSATHATTMFSFFKPTEGRGARTGAATPRATKAAASEQTKQTKQNKKASGDDPGSTTSSSRKKDSPAATTASAASGLGKAGARERTSGRLPAFVRSLAMYPDHTLQVGS